MNRYISVPAEMFDGQKVSEKAMQLAKLFSLEIRKSDSDKDIRIVSEPRIKKVFYENTFLVDHIWSLDITDEFLIMDKEVVLLLDGLVHKPKITEAHSVKFRPRILTGGQKEVSVLIDGNTYLTCTIEEKK